ncbi:hypothetical protein [Rhizosphaericola mali]|nr:hypothetical protein [Rhizosphaericola mali]
MKKYFILAILVMIVSLSKISAQTTPSSTSDSVMVTVFLKHIQDSPVDSIQMRAMTQQFYERIEESHARVVSWYVAMGVGQILTLKFPAKDLRMVNNIFEKGAWGSFHTEFYPTYDFAPIWPQMLEKEKALKKNK